MAQTQSIPALEILGAASTAAASGTAEITRAANRRRIAVFAKVTGGTATVTIQVGTEALNVALVSQASIGTTGHAFTTEAGPFEYVGIVWASNTGTMVVEAIATDAP